MGQIIDTEIEGLGLEERKESYYIYDLNEEKNIFVYTNSEKNSHVVEISKEFLAKLLKYFDDDRENKLKRW